MKTAAHASLQAGRFLRRSGARVKTDPRAIEYAVLDCDIAEHLPFLDPLAFPRTE